MLSRKTTYTRSPIKILLGVCFIVGMSLTTSGQVCDGYLGENLYSAGDFGSGTDNIVQTDPNIAPGYTYTTNPPPPDGTYIITNDINKWSNSYDWLKIQDNSSDPNGYMMVVNASFDPGLFFIQEISGLCENTLYEFSADIFNVIPPGNNYIKPKIKFLINNTARYNTGDIPEDGKWHSYGFTFSTAPGQTSVILKMENDAPGGYGNDLALDNISFRPCGPKATVLPLGVSKVCSENFTPYKLEAELEGNQYKTPFIQWQQSLNRGYSWTDIPDSTGPTFHHNNSRRNFYYYRYIVGNSEDHVRNSKCRVTSNTKIVEVLPTFFSKADTICHGVSYSFGQQVLTESGTYIDSFKSAYGCDSIVLLELYVDKDRSIKAGFNVNHPTCDYLDNGWLDTTTVLNANWPVTYYLDGEPKNSSRIENLEAGVYQYKLVDRNGCSFDTTLTIIKPEPFVIDIFPDWEIKLGQNVEIETKFNYPIETYDWRPSEGITCTIDCNPLSFYPARTTQLVLVATSKNQCIAKDSVQIDVEVARSLYIPTAFSPNSDDLNDLFIPNTVYPQVKQFDYFAIYNRWGQVVYEVKDADPTTLNGGWSGEDAAPGVYVYYVEARFLDDVVLKYRGTLHLIR